MCLQDDLLQQKHKHLIKENQYQQAYNVCNDLFDDYSVLTEI